VAALAVWYTHKTMYGKKTYVNKTYTEKLTEASRCFITIGFNLFFGTGCIENTNKPA
jgi:hypothetical protein